MSEAEPKIRLHRYERILAVKWLEELHGWTLHQLRHSLLTHSKDGTSIPMLLARSRHASVRSLERYARPGPEAVARHVARADRAARPRTLATRPPLPCRDPNRCFFAG